MTVPHRMASPSGTVALALLGLVFVAGTARADRPSTTEGASSIDAPQPAQSFTIAQALTYAHVHQPAIHEALARVSARLEEAKIPTARWLPTVGATAQIFATTANNTTATFVQRPYTDLPRIGGTTSTTTGSLSPYASTLVGLGVTQEASGFGRIEAQRAAADAQVEVERHRSDAQRLDIDLGVEEAYFSVSASKAIVRASDEAYERRLWPSRRAFSRRRSGRPTPRSTSPVSCRSRRTCQPCRRPSRWRGSAIRGSQKRSPKSKPRTRRRVRSARSSGPI